MRTITGYGKVTAAFFLGAFMLLADSPSVTAQLAPAVQVEQLRRLAERDIGSGDFSAALEKLDRILALQAEHGLAEISPEVWFRHGEASYQSQLHAQAVKSLALYVTKAGKEGENFWQAANLLVWASEEIRRTEADSPPLIAQFQPEIQVTLLQAYVNFHKSRGEHLAAAARLDQVLSSLKERNREFKADFWKEEAVWARGEGLYANAAAYADQYLAQGGRETEWAQEVRDVAALIENVKRTAEGFASMNVNAGREFKDCADCPVMVVIPPGSFLMGCVLGLDCSRDEKPVRQVTISQPFAVSKYEVTQDEWGRFTGQEIRGKGPIAGVSWNDARDYLAWLSLKTGEHYRLLSESEWEYSARAGTTTAYSWGNSPSGRHANGGSRWPQDGYDQTAPAGSFEANPFGLHDMHGNVWEWVEDCRNGSYDGAPSDGSAWESGDCSLRVLRGGSWGSNPRDLRSAIRDRYTSGGRYDYRGGFRVARTLAP